MFQIIVLICWVGPTLSTPVRNLATEDQLDGMTYMKHSIVLKIRLPNLLNLEREINLEQGARVLTFIPLLTRPIY